MIFPVVQLLKSMFVQQGLSETVASATTEAVGNIIESYRQVQAELSARRLGIIDIESDTWYIFNMSNRASWSAGLRKWKEVLQREIPRQYFFTKATGPSGGVMPFTVNIREGRDSLDIRLLRIRGGGESIDINAARKVVRDTILQTVKSYIRCTATGGLDFPEDYEG